MFRIGTLADWFGVGLLNGIRASEECGATGVQIYAANELDPRTAEAAFVREVRNTALAHHQTVTALCGELGGFGLEKPRENPEKLDYLKKVILLGQELDCRVVTTHIGVVPADKADPTYRILLDALGEIGAFAHKYGAKIAVETGPEAIGTLRGLIDDVGIGVGINYDPANLVMVGADDEVEGVFAGGDAIVHTHAKDGICVRRMVPGDFYHKFAEGGLEWAASYGATKETPLGQGNVRWIPYLKALQSIGYDGYLTIEREVTNGAEDIRMAVQFLKELMEKL